MTHGKQAIYDANDTILESSWYQNRTNRFIDQVLLKVGKDPGREKIAADKAAKHAQYAQCITLRYTRADRCCLLTIIKILPPRWMSLLPYNNQTGHGRKPENGNRCQGKYRHAIQIRYAGKPGISKQYGCRTTAGCSQIFWVILYSTWDERNHEFQYFYDIAQKTNS